MKKLLKALLWLVTVVVVLVGAAVVLIPILFDPNDYKDTIAAQVKDQTGRELAIEGELKMSVFPWLGVDIGPTSLGNAAGFTAPVFASSERVQVRVKLMPLLERRIEMDTVTVHGLQVNLERDAKGTGNWDDLVKAGKGSDDKTAAGGDSDATSLADGPAIAGLALGGISIQDASVSWADAAAGLKAKVSSLNLKTDKIELGKPIKITGGLDVSLSKPNIAGRVELTARVAANGPQIKAEGTELKLNLTGDTLPGETLAAVLNADIEVDNAKQTATIGNLKLQLAGLSMTGSLKAAGLQSKPAFTAKIDIASFNLRELMQALEQPVPVTADATVLGTVAISAGISGTADSIALMPLSVALDDSKIDGRFAVRNFSKPGLRFDLKIDKIDADRYLPAVSAGGGSGGGGAPAKAATPGAAAASANTLPLEQLRALDIDGKVALGALKLSGLSMSDMVAVIKAKGGQINLSPVAAKLYSGSYAGNIGFNAKGKTAKLSLNERLKGVQIGPLLKDLGGEDRLEGTANATIKATTSGNIPEAMKKTLNGSGNFKFANGALKGVNLAAMIRDAKARLSGANSNAGNEPNQTDFSELGGTFKIVNGLVSNNDFSAKSPLLRLKGKGSANLVSETLDYRVTTSVVASAKGQGGKELTDLAGIDIPVKITGSFAKPKYGLDEEALVKALATGKAKELIGKGSAGVKKAVQGKLKDAVGGKALGDLTKKLGGAVVPGTGGAAEKPAANPAAAASKALKSLFK
jgi:AsmA protein